MKTKRFISQAASNKTIKVFNAETGQLHRIINVSGEIVSQPVCLESEMYVTVKRDNKNYLIYYTLPNGSVKRTQPL